MASKNVARPADPRKSPRVVGAFPSKLLHDCTTCGRPVFSCRKDRAIVDVEVLEAPTGNIAIQIQIGDVLEAVEISIPRTWYRLHRPVCPGPRSFTKAPGAGKVRP